MSKITFEGHGLYELDDAKLLADYKALRAVPCRYSLGAKSRSSIAPRLVNLLDCSGYVRYSLTRQGIPIVDGSQSQREWAIREGLKRSDPEACLLEDDIWRLAVLPTTISRRVGHVVLVRNGRTYESHGSVGVDSRLVKDLPWFDECAVFVLARPTK